MSDYLVDEEEVYAELNFIEQALSHLDAEDEFQAALLRNQKLLAQALMGIGPAQSPGPMNMQNVDKDNLPEGLTGTATQEIPNGGKGTALFNIGGSRIEAEVRAGGDIGNNETLVVIDDNNLVRPSPGTQETFNLQVAGATGGGNQDYFATESSVPVESVEEKALNWEFQADEVAIYGFDAPIFVAFKNKEEDNRLIPLKPEDEPFSIKITAPGMYFRKASEDTSDTTIRVVALK